MNDLIWFANNVLPWFTIALSLTAIVITLGTRGRS